MLLRVAAFLERHRIDPSPLFHALSLDPTALAVPDARVSYVLVARFGELALAALRDDDFGLHLARDVENPGALDVGVLLLLASPTLGDALHTMERVQRYWGDGARASLHRAKTALVVRYTLPLGQGAYARHADECALAEIALGVRTLAGTAITPRAVRFRHAQPIRLAEHLRVFGIAPSFGEPHTEIEFDHATLATPLPHANAMFASVFEAEVAKAIARLPNSASIAEAVRATARLTLARRGATLAATAKSLGMSTRTLQRELEDEGTSFAAIVDALRRELSIAYLERGVPIAELARLLGYAETTAFRHAFRRWHGVSPTKHDAHRARARRG